MPISAMFAAGLFDSPWIVALLIIGSALVNWLAKRRQEKQSGPPPEGDQTSPSSRPSPGEFNLEETLRRLMGEESPPPPPPLIPHAARGELPPTQTWSEEKLFPPEPARQRPKPAAPVLRHPIVVAQVSAPPRPVSQTEEQAARRFEQLNEQGRHPATVVDRQRQRSGRSGPPGASRWRDSRSMRRAFVASLVFAPPKSIEP